jgi:hypothetical protein
MKTKKNTNLSGFEKCFCFIQTDHLWKYQNENEKQKYYIVGIVPNPIKTNTQIHDHPLSCLGTDTSIKGGGV